MSILVALPTSLYPADAFAGFDPAPGAVPSNARGMAWAAQLAYDADDAQKTASVLQRWDFSLVEIFARSVQCPLPLASTRVFVAMRDDVIWVSFEGTDPLVVANWVSDFDVLPGPSGVTQGFAQALDAVWPDLSSLLARERGGRKVFVTGHSLGGALAVVAAQRMADPAPGGAPDAVFAFGMPRVGDADFADAYQRCGLTEKTIRLVYGEDVVPTVPPIAAGFRHVGRRWSTARGHRFDPAAVCAHPDNEPTLDGNLADKMKGLLHAPAGAMLAGGIAAPRTDIAGRIINGLPGPLRDHIPDCYCAALA